MIQELLDVKHTWNTETCAQALAGEGKKQKGHCRLRLDIKNMDIRGSSFWREKIT
jgi:hypothetical protein